MNLSGYGKGGVCGGGRAEGIPLGVTKGDKATVARRVRHL